MEKQMSHKICCVKRRNHCDFLLRGRSPFFCFKVVEEKRQERILHLFNLIKRKA